MMRLIRELWNGLSSTRRAKRVDFESVTGEWEELSNKLNVEKERAAHSLALALEAVTVRRRSEAALEAIETYAQYIVDTVREPLLILDTTLRVQSANRAFYQTFHVSSEETENRFIYELGEPNAAADRGRM